jgi:hypothetical protein
MADDPKHWIGKIKADPCLRYSFLVFLLIINLLSIIALIIGLIFRGQCSIERNIPIYLIVAGFIFTIYYIFLLIMVSISVKKDSIDILFIVDVCNHSIESF